MPKNIKLAQVAVIACILIGAASIFTVLYLRNKSDDAPRTSGQDIPTITQATTPKPPNEVDYGPSSPTDNEEINNKKANADGATPTPDSSDVRVTITNTRVSDGLAQVSALIEGATTGTCTVVLSKTGAQDVSKDSSVTVHVGGKAGCQNFDIPVTQLAKGTWNVSLRVTTTDNKSATTEGTLIVE